MKTSNSEIILGELAERAGRLYGKSVVAWIDTAYLLLEARKVAEYGEWLPFLEHAGIPLRTAQRMLRIAEAGHKSDTVSRLGGIRATLQCLAAGEEACELWKAALAALSKCESCGSAECEAVAVPRSAVRQAVPDEPVNILVWLRAPHVDEAGQHYWRDFAKAIPTLRASVCRELLGDTA